MKQILACLLFPVCSLLAEDPEARFARMSPEEVRAFEIEVMETDRRSWRSSPRKLNTSPLPQYDYDRLDYGMTIGIERTPGRTSLGLLGGGRRQSPRRFSCWPPATTTARPGRTPRLVVDAHSKNLPLDRSVLVGNLWTDPLGRLWLIFDQSLDMFDGRAGVWAAICENPDADQPAWSPPRRIWHGVTLNKPTVLSTGAWMLPISLDQRPGFGPFQGAFRELDPFRGANVFVSTDQGVTWLRRGCVRFPEPGLARTHDRRTPGRQPLDAGPHGPGHHAKHLVRRRPNLVGTV